MRVAGGTPTAPQLRDMFRCFVTDAAPVAPRELVVSARFEDVPNAADLETTLTYTEHSVTIPEARMQVLRTPSGFRLHGPGELLTSTLPLIDALMVAGGAATFHAATIDYRGRGVALPAAGGTGKTSTIAKFMRLDGAAFMGDDWAFLSEEGQLLGFAKPMFIKPHHRAIYPHLFEGPRKPMVPVSLSRPVGHLTTIVHPFIARYPRAAAFSRRWSPEHRMTTPEKALPGKTISTAAPLTLAVYLERYAGSATRVVERSREWMASRMVGNFHIEMPGHSQGLVTALGATSVLPLDEYFSRKAAVIRSALDGVPTYLMQVPAAMSPDEASDSIVAHVRELLGEEG
ncbi:hypothetical protein GB882_05390 [Georgenia ruanii]|uniref:Serine kinase n=2 Tax=Georgenia ruanii TaxID=348442 RepID=A0A7J9UWK5_9MICO|nr:hypothetical protein [Georgenia ruanii]